MKYISPQSFYQAEEHLNKRYRVIVGKDISFVDLFRHQTWMHCAHRLKKYDTIRVIASDDSFDVELTVIGLSENGVDVRVKNRCPETTENILKSVPVADDGFSVARIQYLDGSEWRLIGADGKEVKRNMLISQAREALRKYLADASMYIPDGVPFEHLP